MIWLRFATRTPQIDNFYLPTGLIIFWGRARAAVYYHGDTCIKHFAVARAFDYSGAAFCWVRAQKARFILW